LNPYILILILFLLGGLGTTVWGWTIIARGKRTLKWPAVDGVIEKSRRSSNEDDLLPEIVFSYSVSGSRHERSLEFPSGTNPTPALSASYVAKYPEGAPVQVYYNPVQPEQATLEPGPGRDDWLVFILGIMVTVIGLGFLLFGG